MIMARKSITVAVDSFKGSLSSMAVAEAVEAGVRGVVPDCDIRLFEVADGGEGMASSLVGRLGGEWIDVATTDALGRDIVARYGVVDGGRTAIVEMASAAGLTQIPPSERNPLLTSTYGVGRIIAAALDRGCRRFLVGIGGSATNDAGVGMLQALGFRFLDSAGCGVAGCGRDLERIVRIDSSAVRADLTQAEFRVACDVASPLYGAQGAAYIFAPQKGADASMVERLDRGLRNFAARVAEYNGRDIAHLPGAGAAGGLGGGFAALLDASLESGVDIILDAINFDNIIKGSMLVITGEGRIDHQTMMGKAPCGILRRARQQGIPVVAICGGVERCESVLKSGFESIVPIVGEDVPLALAMQAEYAAEQVRRSAAQIAREYLLP